MSKYFSINHKVQSYSDDLHFLILTSILKVNILTKIHFVRLVGTNVCQPM